MKASSPHDSNQMESQHNIYPMAGNKLSHDRLAEWLCPAACSQLFMQIFTLFTLIANEFELSLSRSVVCSEVVRNMSNGGGMQFANAN
jgi:hypothetical protein